jgi:replicative DNA helicase
MTTASDTVSLSQFGKHFQEVCVQALLNDHAWAEQVLEVFNVEYLDLAYLRFLADRYFTYAKKYHVFPSFNLLVSIIKDELKVGTDIALRDQVIDYLTRIKATSNSNDIAYVKDKVLDFARKQALKRALTDAVDQLQAEKYEQIVESIKKAVCVGTTPALGHDFFKDHEARFTRLQRNAITTGIEVLDRKDILNGGLGAGELGVIVGATGAGKSHFLVMLGSAAMRAGIDVLHYTMELSEASTGIRYDSNLCDIDSNNVIDQKNAVLDVYKQRKFGRLMIKEFPANSATIYTIRAHMEALDIRENFRPGLLIVDYADIVKSTRAYESLRHELKLVYEELRAFAAEKKLPLWTASQSNREGANSDIIDLTNMSEAFGKAMVSDVVLSISRKSEEKSTGCGRLYVAKNRAGKDGLVYPIQIDTARSKFVVVGNAQGLEDSIRENEQEFKKAIRVKLDELKNDPTFQPTTTDIHALAKV